MRVLADHPAILADLDALSIGADLNRAPDRTGHNRVSIVVEANQTGFGHRCLDGVKAVEAARVGNKMRPLPLKAGPDRLVRELGVLVCLGKGDTPVEQPGVELVVALDPQPRREEALPH